MSGTFWQTFSAAPHRMMMFGGAVQLVAVMLYWAFELFGRHTSLWDAPATTIPGIFAHAFLLLYTVFPFFIFGFLMTTYPRWMSGLPVPLARYQTAFLLLAGGVAAIYAGLFYNKTLAMAGVAVLLCGYGIALHALWRVYRQAPARDKFYESCLNSALTGGFLGIVAYLTWLAGGSAGWLQLSLHAGLWWFLLPVAVTVSHRMLPFFSVNVLPDYQVYQPKASLLPMLVLLAVHGMLDSLTGLSLH